MKPSFSITDKMLNLITEISKTLEVMDRHGEKVLKLRKENRIKSIQSSLAIENNSLTIEQITDIIDGKRVLGKPSEIQEVKNAFEVYEKLLTLNPYSEKDFLLAHKTLTKDLVATPGKYRTKDVGIYDKEGNVLHIGARPQFIKSLMDDLFSWGKEDKTSELIKSCVIHYEIETIHPFEDGNGRMGRLWQNVILTKWNPIFEYIPTETIIHENQAKYYEALKISDINNDSSVFIEFMLETILQTLLSFSNLSRIQDCLNKVEKEAYNQLSKYLSKNQSITTAEAVKLIKKASPTVRRYLSKFSNLGLLEKRGENKNRVYFLTQDRTKG